jgi:hypothetical protein
MTDQLSNPEQAFDKALCLLDRGEGEKAEALLELVITAARTSSEQVLLARALCVLGEWLHEQGRADDARQRLVEVLAVQVEEADLIAYEQSRARDILSSERPES